MDKTRVYILSVLSKKKKPSQILQYNKKWDSISTSLLYQSEHCLFLLGSLLCLFLWPGCVSQSGYCHHFPLLSVTVDRESTTVYLGSNIMLIYFVMWWFCFNISNIFLSVLRWFCFAWLLFFGVCLFVLWCISVLNQYNRGSCSITHSSDTLPGY